MYYTTRKFHFERAETWFPRNLSEYIDGLSGNRRTELHKKGIPSKLTDSRNLHDILFTIGNTGYGIVLTKHSDFPIGSEHDTRMIAPDAIKEIPFETKYHGFKLDPCYARFLEQLGYQFTNH